MNRAQRRRLERQAKKGTGAALLAAQELSRAELDTALGNWAGLAGAENMGPYTRSVTVTNRLDKRVTVTADLRIFPAPDAGDKPYVLFLNPLEVSSAEARIAAADVDGDLVEVFPSRAVKTGEAILVDRANLTDEQYAHLAGGAG